MALQAIVGGRVVLPDAVIDDGVVVVDRGRIAACGSREDTPVASGAQVVEARGAIVGPGLIDIHCHGGGGKRFTEDVGLPLRTHVEHGVTGVLATTAYRTTEEAFSATTAGVRDALDGPYGGAMLGINVEGPPINPKYGALSQQARRPGMDEYVRMLDAAGDLIKVWTVAPEVEGADTLIDMLHERGVVVSVGHSDAAAERVLELVPKGLRLATHCMDATGVTPDPTRYGGTREAGVDEAVLLSDDIYAEVIPDSWGIHVRSLMLQLILKVKGRDRVILISDAVEMAGMDAFRYVEEGDRWVVADRTDVNFNEDGELSGSKLTLNYAVRNMMSHTGVGLAEAFGMASLTPARLLGVDGERGSIEVGKRADIGVFAEGMGVRKVMLGGEWI